MDTSGCIYITGETMGNLGGTYLGGHDSYILKYDSYGSLLWSQHIGTSAYDHTHCLAVDNVGNVFVTGYTSGSLAGVNAGGEDVFLSKYDTLGNLLWTKQTGTYRDDCGQAVGIDSSGNIYISGYTCGSLGGTISGVVDTFVMKYDTFGNRLWSQQSGWSGNDYGRSMAVDLAGNSYVAGEASVGTGGWYGFLVKYDTLGNRLWSRQIGSGCYAVAVDAAGSAYLGGTGGDIGGPNVGSSDDFLVKYDGDGNQVWAGHFGTLGDDTCRSVTVDSEGNTYLMGGPGGHCYIVKFDSSGNVLWSQIIDSDLTIQRIALSQSDELFATGRTRGNLDGINAGGEDVFLTKYEVPEPATLLLLAMGGLSLLRSRRVWQNS